MYTEEITAVLRQEIAEAVIGVLEKPIAETIGSRTRFVHLSWASTHKQHRRHTDIREWHYHLLPTIIERGLVVHDTRGLGNRINIYYRQNPGNAFLVTVKATKNGNRLYVLRFHRARAKTPKALLKRGPVLRPHK